MLTSVNPNTVIKALTWLQENDVLTTQRGVGYFLTEGAARKTLALKRREFIEDDVHVEAADSKRVHGCAARAAVAGLFPRGRCQRHIVRS